jgi:Mn2+/Fe2+ NRAMP family transporter
MCLVYLTYVAAAIIAKPDWGEVFRRTVIPSSDVKVDSGYLVMVIALIGTTIAPWMQFYVQSSVRDKGITSEEYPLERVDVISGSVISNAISYFIIVTCAVTLFPRVIADAGEAAQALSFAGGEAAKVLFAIGLLNAALVGAVVVPLSTAYAVTESLGWEGGLGRRIREAPLFIGVYTGVIVIAAVVILVSRVPPLGIIMASQVINGILLPVVLILMLRLVNKRRLMGDYVNSPVYNVLAGATVVIVTALSLSYFFLSFRGA